MKAVVIEAPGIVHLQDCPMPLVDPESVLIRVSFCGICGTDFAICSGETSFVRDGLIKYPVRIGHEFSGVVEQVGTAVINFKPGDHVVCDDMVSCGVCQECLKKNHTACTKPFAVGTVNCWDGAFAEYIAIPEFNVYHLPHSITLEEAALIEPATIAYNAVKACHITSESRVLVIGTGCIGLSAVALIKTLYGATVYISGRKEMKLQRARIMGADALINVITENIEERIMQLTDGAGVDVVIEASGNISALNESLYLTREDAEIALIGFYEKPLTGFNIDRFVLRRIHMQGITGLMGVPPIIVQLIEAKHLSLLPLITQHLTLEEVPAVLLQAQENSANIIKMIVQM